MTFRSFIAALVYSNCWIAIGAAASCCQFYILTKTEINVPLLVFIFSSTVLTYTFQRYAKLSSGIYDKSERMLWMRDNPKLVQSIMICSAIVSLFVIVSFSLIAIFFILCMASISFFYIRKIPGAKGRNLRDRPFIKIYLISLVWALTSVILPILLAETIEWQYSGLVAVNFLFILAITIPFDIRDIQYDEKEKRTIPQLFGIQGAKILASILALGSGCLIVFMFEDFWIPAAIAVALTIALILGSSPKRKDMYYSFWIDGLLLAQFGVILGYWFLTIHEAIANT